MFDSIFSNIIRLFEKLAKLIIDYFETAFPTSLKGETMDIIALLNQLSATIASMQAALVDAQIAAESIAKESYDKGFAEGVASVLPNVDKIYSQAELDQKISEALVPMNDQVAALGVELQVVKDSIEGLKSEAVAAFKAELKVKYDEMQVIESSAETGFASLLS